MLGARKQFKVEDRARRRSNRARLSRTKGTDKPSTRKPGIYFSSKPASLKGGALFKHAKPPLPDGTWGIPIRLKKKYRPIAGA